MRVKRWIKTCRICQTCNKTIGLASWGQPNGDQSMPVKEVTPSYDVYGKDNESLYTYVSYEMDLSVFRPKAIAASSFYIMRNSLDKSLRRNVSNILTWGYLNTSSILYKNSGSADGRNSWVDRGNVVTVRFMSTGKVTKYKSFKEIMPTGLLELEKLVKDNFEKAENIKYQVKHILCDPEILVKAYSRIKNNKGKNLVKQETLDGLEDFKELGKKLATGEFEFTPKKLLRITSPRDKIVQEAMRMILEAVYEPMFAEQSHGFRPKRSCHSALKYVKLKFGSAKWFIELDIKKCFDNFEPKLIIEVIKEKIEDQVFLDLMYKALKAGYIDLSGKFDLLEVGSTQGSIISPILCNIYLDKLDDWITAYAKTFNIGIRKKAMPVYRTLIHKSQMAGPNLQLRKGLRKKIHDLETKNPSYKRMISVRYAYALLIGIIGSKDDAIKICEDLSKFLNEQLRLNTSMEKSKITHSSKGKTYFLGTEIRISTRLNRISKGVVINCTVNPRPKLLAPVKKIVEKLKEAGYCRFKDNRPTSKGNLIHLDLGTIIENYLAVARGIINYYTFASNFVCIRSRVLYIMYYSCVLTIASKLKLLTKSKVIKKFGIKLKVESKNSRSGFIEFDVNRFPNKAKGFKTANYDPLSVISLYQKKTYLTNVTFRGPCKICNKEEETEVHHVQHLRKMNKRVKADYLTKQMIKMNRRQIPLCKSCHKIVHQGKYCGPKL